MSDIYYAIGDVHGRDDLLAKMHARIAEDHAFHHGDVRATLVHVGDYIDRGPNSMGVIDRLMRGVPGFDVVCLKGNHEHMMLVCMEKEDLQTWRVWLTNGGDATLESIGLPVRLKGYDHERLRASVGEERVKWLQLLPTMHQAGDYLFVHAGIFPGRPIEEQRDEDLIWIRHRFLDSQEDHGVLVIHGHTPGDEPVVRPNRICIDTLLGAYRKLTAVVLGEEGGPRFLSVK